MAVTNHFETDQSGFKLTGLSLVVNLLVVNYFLIVVCYAFRRDHLGKCKEYRKTFNSVNKPQFSALLIQSFLFLFSQYNCRIYILQYKAPKATAVVIFALYK